MKYTIPFDLVPTTGNPRNSEGSFGRLPDGKMLFVYSRFSGGQADNATADLGLLISEDGCTWEDQGILYKASDEQALNMMSVTLLELMSGELALFYLIRQTDLQMNLFMRKTTDGLHWSDPVNCTPQTGYFVINNDRVIQLGSGRILVPIAAHRKGSWLDRKGLFFDGASETICFYSDDNGVTWSAGTKNAMPFHGYTHAGLQEPGLLELKNGVIWQWARTDVGRQFECFSLDQGKTWTTPQPSWFTAPCSPLSMKRLPDDRLIAIWNPVPLYNGRSEDYDGCWTGGRTPLVYALSTDDGRTWSEPVALEDEPSHGYCYTAIYPSEDRVLLSYCCGGPEDGSCLARLRIRSLLYSEL